MTKNRSGGVKAANEAPAAESPLPVPPKPDVYKPDIGDVVLFNHRNPNAHSSITLPMVVTKVHADGISLDGVALNTNNTGGTMGAICAHGVLPGKGDFEWRVK